MRVFTPEQVAEHNNEKDCWIIIHGKVYDVTSFLPEHPGGAGIILKYAGKDATKAFDPIHPSDIIEKLLPPSVLKGTIAGPVTTTKTVTPSAEPVTEEDKRRAEADKNKPHLDQILNLNDFEAVAKKVMRPDGWAYYSSAADDEITYRENRLAFHRIWMKPRVMVNVRDVSISSSILGYPTSIPVYVTATALGRLGHPQGETVLTRASHTENIIQMIPTLASCSLDEIVAARGEGQVQFFQLYVNSNREITKALIQKAERLGCKALFVTVDAPTLAKREKDMRMKYINRPPDVQEGHTINRAQGAARAIGSFIDAGLCWDDIAWFRSLTKLPIVLKGIQCGEDAVLAVKHGVDGIVVSNHGGRQLDFSRSGIETLAEVMDHLKRIGAQDKLEVYMDGGVRRGTDIFKALALGAKAVGIGRPFLFAMSSYGQIGVERAIQILKDEFEMVMRLMGVTRIDEIRPEMICTRNLPDHVVVPKDYLAHDIYDRMMPPKSRL